MLCIRTPHATSNATIGPASMKEPTAFTTPTIERLGQIWSSSAGVRGRVVARNMRPAYRIIPTSTSSPFLSFSIGVA